MNEYRIRLTTTIEREVTIRSESEAEAARYALKTYKPKTAGASIRAEVIGKGPNAAACGCGNPSAPGRRECQTCADGLDASV